MSAAAQPTPTRAVVQICSWCLPTVRVIGLPAGLDPAARLAFEVNERNEPISAWTFSHGKFVEFPLSHGICGLCRVHFAARANRVH